MKKLLKKAVYILALSTSVFAFGQGGQVITITGISEQPILTTERGDDIPVTITYTSTETVLGVNARFGRQVPGGGGYFNLGNAASRQDLPAGTDMTATFQVPFPDTQSFTNGTTTIDLNPTNDTDGVFFTDGSVYQLRFNILTVDTASGAVQQQFIIANQNSIEASLNVGGFTGADSFTFPNGGATPNPRSFAINGFRISEITEPPVLSVAEFSKEDISSSMYPNPVSSELTIGVETETYKVINLGGATVLEAAGTGVLNVSSLTNGIYFLVTDAGTAKFVKQ